MPPCQVAREDAMEDRRRRSGGLEARGQTDCSLLGLINLPKRVIDREDFQVLLFLSISTVWPYARLLHAKTLWVD